MSREDLEKQFERQYKDKSPEEMIEIGRQIALKSIQKEKQGQLDRINGLRAIFNLCNPLPSDRFKNKK